MRGWRGLVRRQRRSRHLRREGGKVDGGGVIRWGGGLLLGVVGVEGWRGCLVLCRVLWVCYVIASEILGLGANGAVCVEHGMRPIEKDNIPGSTKYGSTGPAVSDYVKVEGGESSRGKSGKGGSGGGGGGRGGGGVGGGGAKGDSKGKYFEPRYPDQECDDLPRVDIEDINKVYESDDDVIITGTRKIDRKGKSPAPRGGLKPIRLHREEHKERVTIVNTAPEAQSEIKKDPEPAPEDEDSDIPMVDEERSGLPTNEPIATRVKSEPAEDTSLPGPASPESKRKGKGKELASYSIIDTSKKQKRKAALMKKDQKPVLQTDEDRAEYERHLLDVQVLAEELGGMQARSQPSGGDVAMSGVEAEGVDKKDGRLYLFQFPGVLTKLYNPATKPKPKPKPGKPQPTEKDKDVEILPSSKPPQIEAEEGEVIIKQEEEASNVNENVVEEIGAVGKMVVRKSGRVEIRWGNTDMLVQRGTETGFLGAGYVVDGAVGADAEGMKVGVSTGMGMMMGKFVVVPDFEKSW
jgi:DNA-directed RNA polymerase III subunit RPC4